MLRSSGYALVLVLVLASAGSLLAMEPLFFVNDPKSMTFVDMGQVAKYLETYYQEHGVTKPEDVDKFYEVIKTHGAPEAGASDARVALVVQDAQDPANKTGQPRGVLVIQGRYDKEKVLDMLTTQYNEHCQKTNHQPKASNTTLPGGESQHSFALPEGGHVNRELNIVSWGNVVLYASAATGDRELLEQTMSVLKGQSPSAPMTSGKGSVTYNYTLTPWDKEQLNKAISGKYQAWKDDKLRVSKRKGLKGWFTNRIADAKVHFINESLAECDNVNVKIDRARDAQVESKKFSMTATFADESRAREVKRKLLRHLNGIIKETDKNADRLGIQSNVKITCEGNHCNVDCDLNGADEQYGAFALISSYVARGILKN